MSATESSRRGSVGSNADEDMPPPALDTINPMVFVPLEDSLFKPFEIPRTKTERLELTMKRLNKYSDGMDENIWHSMRRERDRVYQKLRLSHKQDNKHDHRHHNKLPRPTGILPEEVESMVENLAAPAVPDKDYSQPPPPKDRSSGRWIHKNQDHAAHELSVVLTTGALGSFAFVEEHRKSTTNECRQAIEREKAAEARIGTTGDEP